MGKYVNPTDGSSKEEWLQKNGTMTGNTPCAITEEFVPVCWVNNGPFSAAGVADDSREVEAFNRPDDIRPKRWFQVSREALRSIGVDV